MRASMLSQGTSSRLAADTGTTCAMQAGHVPDKLNTVIQPLMGGIRREADPQLRQVVASALARLVSLCSTRSPSPNDRHARPVPADPRAHEAGLSFST